MQPILSSSMWASLPTEVRQQLRSIFNIPRSSHVEVSDGRLLTDGTTPEDFKALTIEKMQEYLETNITDFYALFDLVLARVRDKLEGKSIDPVPEILKPKRGRPAKK